MTKEMAASNGSSAQQPKLTTTNYETVRVSVVSPNPFDDVMKKLYASVGSESAWPSKISTESLEAFSNDINAAVGPHGFMFFKETNYEALVSVFGVADGLKAKRVTIGNPLIAITMLRHDIGAALFVPVDLLVTQERHREFTKIMYNLPSAQITAGNDSVPLMEAAKKLDEKLGLFVRAIAE